MNWKTWPAPRSGTFCNHPAFEGSRVRIMPDVHAGAGCVIGFTAELKTDKVIPNLIGVDIGCGVLTARLSGLPDFSSFDARLRERVPSGMHARPSVHQALLDDPELDEEISRICMDVLRTDKDRHRRSVGSLGGGNHFIEIAQGKEHAFLCIHLRFPQFRSEDCGTLPENRRGYLSGRLS